MAERKSVLKLNPKQLREANKLCVELPLMEARLREAGLFATAAALNKAVKKIGYEVARKMP